MNRTNSDKTMRGNAAGVAGSDPPPSGPCPSAFRVLVVKLSSLGDLFHALPAVHVLKQHGTAIIDWVVQSEYAGLVSCFTDVDRVIEFPRRHFLKQAPGFLRALRAGSYDLIVDLQGLLKSALTARLARGGPRVGTGTCREGSGLFYSLRPPSPANGSLRRHAVLECLEPVRYLGLNGGDPVFPVRFPQVELSGPGPHVGLVPGSRWASKNWPVESFRSLAAGLRRSPGGSIHLLGGPADRTLCKKLMNGQASDAVFDHSGSLDLVGLGGVLQALDLVITNDTGPMHMAAAAGTPVVALFGPTDPLRTGPWGAGHRVLRADPLPACAPCYRRRCPADGHICMARIPVENVLAAAQEMLASHGGNAEQACGAQDGKRIG